MAEMENHLNQSQVGFENILFITIDALRYDTFEFISGKKEFETFNEIVTNGITFKNHFSVASPTQFSFSSLLSSRLPLDDRGYDHGVADRPIVVSECFEKEGFHTQAFSNCREMSLYQGYGRGFSDFYYFTDVGRIINRISFNLERLRLLVDNDRISEQDAIEFIEYDLGLFFPAIKRHMESIDPNCEGDGISQNVYSPYSKHDKDLYNKAIDNTKQYKNSPEVYSRQLLQGESDFFDITHQDEIASLDYRNRFVLKYDWLKKVLKQKEGLKKGLSLTDPTNTIYPFEQTLRFKPSRTSNISSSGEIIKHVCDQIENVDDSIFQWVHLYDVHDRLFYSYDREADFIREEVADHRRKLQDIDEVPTNLLSDPGYFYALSQIDHKIRKLIDQLKRSNVLDETLIVFTSDHGIPLKRRPKDRRDNHIEEAFHVQNFFDEFYHVPLVFYNPNIEPKTITKLTSSIDVAPSLVNAAGIKSPDEFRGSNLFMNSGRDYVLFEHFGRGLGIHGVKRPRITIRNFNWKIGMEFPSKGPVSSGEVREIYNLQNDPNETNNMRDYRTEEIIELMEKIRSRAEYILNK